MKLKMVFTTKPILAIPDIDREMRVEADTSDYATGEYCRQSAKIGSGDQ